MNESSVTQVLKCGHCGAAFMTIYGTQLYCSPACRHRAKYERQKANGSEQRKRELRKARYVPRAPRFSGECRVCGSPFRAHIATKRYCSPHCRRVNAWRKDTSRKREALTHEVGALDLNGRPLIVEVQPMGTGGWVVICPCHDGRCFMGVRHGIDAYDERWCPACGAVIKVNTEEADALLAA